MNRSIPILVAICSVLGSGTSFSEDTVESAKLHIAAQLAKVHAFTAEFSTTIDMQNRKGRGMTTEEKGTIAYMKKDGRTFFRMESDSTTIKKSAKKEDKNMSVHSVFCYDGEHLYLEMKEGGQVLVIRSKPSKEELLPYLRIINSKALFDLPGELALSDGETIDGEETYVLTRTYGATKGKTDPGIRVYLSKKTGMTVKHEAFDKKGNTFSSRKYTNIKTNISFPGNAFDYTPPPGAEIIEEEE